RGADPRVTFDGTVDGWKRTVDNRDAILDIVKANDERCCYEMTASDLMGRNYQRVMSIEHGVETVIDADRWGSTLKPINEEKRNEWRGMLLRDFVADKESLAADDAQRLTDAYPSASFRSASYVRLSRNWWQRRFPMAT